MCFIRTYLQSIRLFRRRPRCSFCTGSSVQLSPMSQVPQVKSNQARSKPTQEKHETCPAKFCNTPQFLAPFSLLSHATPDPMQLYTLCSDTKETKTMPRCGTGGEQMQDARVCMVSLRRLLHGKVSDNSIQQLYTPALMTHLKSFSPLMSRRY